MKGLIHCHSENSRYDSAMNVETLCKRAKELGYEAVTLTDHGTLTGIDDFVKAAKDVGIKPIPGVEAYMQEDDSALKRLHLILLAKDDLGYTAIGKAVTESNRRIDDRGFPRMNKEILNKYFGPESKYHGHVIATSACVGGVLAGMLLSPLEFNKTIRKLEKRQSRYESTQSASYLANQKALEENEQKVTELVELRDTYTALSKKTYKKRENALAKTEGKVPNEEYAAAKAALDAEKAESEAAKAALDDVRAKISLTKKASTLIKAKLKEAEESNAKYMNIQKEIDKVKSEMIPLDELYQDVCREAKWYDETFGHGNFYIELQYHGYLVDSNEDIEEETQEDSEGEEIEKLAMPYLVKMAKELSLPLVAANDAHIPDGSADSIRARQIICSIRYAKKGFISEVRKGDDQIYLKSEEELREAILNVASPEEVDEAIENTYRICEECNCEFKNGSHYPKFQGLEAGENADQALRRMAKEGIERRFPNGEGWTDTYKERLEYELQVISDMGYSDYFLIVQDFLAFGRKLGHLSNKSLDYLKENIKALSLKELVDYVDAHQERPGFAIGAGRGSAAGSLVAYLVGITNIIDPLKYDLLFEREKIALLKFG